MAATAVFPGRIPTLAPANQIVPFTRAPSLAGGGVVPLSQVAPPAPSVVPPIQGAAPLPAPSVRPSGVSVGVSTLRGASAAAPAVAVAQLGAAAVVARVAGGVVGAVLGDLVFPQSVANAEAPGIDPSVSPSVAPNRENVPITSPSGGLYANTPYLLTFTIFVKRKQGSVNPDYEFVNAFGALGSNVPSSITGFSSSYPANSGGDIFYIKSLVVTQNGSPSGALSNPNLAPTIPAQQPAQPLQNPVPVDSEGNRRLFVPPPAPVIVPFVRPAPQRTAPPAPAPNVPVVPSPPVIPEKEPDAPPFSPPVPYNPASPVPSLPFQPFRPPIPDPPGFPPFLPVPPPRPGITRTPVTVPLVTVTPSTPPVNELGYYTPPESPSSPPPIVPPTRRQRGADCCDPEPSGGLDDCCEEILEKLEELHKCACPDERELRTSPLGSGDSLIAELPNDTVRVSVQVTDVGTGVRTQSGNPNGETVHFLGWYAFGRDGKWDDRKPISHLYSEFCCPKRGNMFTFTLVFGSSGSAVATYLLPAND